MSTKKMVEKQLGIIVCVFLFHSFISLFIIHLCHIQGRKFDLKFESKKLFLFDPLYSNNYILNNVDMIAWEEGVMGYFI